jgi:spore coat polysaccharide biosynthesis predicted glycosyltransferase SpsG
MRSSILAEEAISRGHECVFIGRIDDLSWVESYVSQLGYTRIFCSEDQYVPNNKTDTLILDSYSIDPSSRFVSKDIWKQIVCIHDSLTPSYNSDIELMPGFSRGYDGEAGRRILTGPEYVLVRKGTKKSKRLERSGLPLKVLIVGGGSDPFGFVEAICKLLPDLNLSLEIHVFGNKVFADSKFCLFVTHPFGASLDLVAEDVDVVLSTASTSSLEFIARELPCGIVCAVNNQKELYDQLGDLSYALPLGCLDSDGAWDFNLKNLTELLSILNLRDQIRSAISGLVDLKGPSRVLDEIEGQNSLKLR